jgi:pyruvate formate lyase activating enzyme
MGIHNVIETNGFLGDRLSDEELKLIDLVLLDVKSWGSERHRQLTGKPIEPTLEFGRRLASLKRPLWVRLVLVPGLTDDREIVSGIADFAAGLGVVERVEVLPFHQMGRYKWERLGLEYKLKDAQSPSPELVEETCRIFREHGLQAY